MMTAAETRGIKRMSEPGRKRWFDNWTAVALVFLIAVGLRFTGITFDSMWLDEGYQTIVDAYGIKPDNLEKLSPTPFIYDLGAPQSPSQVLLNFRQVDPLCPPLYFLALNRWMTMMGTSDLAIRSLSTVISIFSLAVLYFGTRKLFGARTALLALAIQGLSPYDITYAQEARMYALVTLTSTISCLSFFLLARQARERAASLPTFAWMAVYSVSTWALINSHYTGLFVVAFQGLYGIAYSIKHRSLPTFLTFSGAWGLVILLWLPWFDLFRQSASGRNNFYVNRAASLWWPFKGLLKVVLNWINFIGGGRIVAYAAPLYSTSVALLLGCVAIVLPQKVRDWFASKFKKGTTPQAVTDGSNEQTKQALTFIWCWALIPALVALAADIAECRKTVEVSRYLISTAPAVFILAACGAKYLLERSRAMFWLVAIHFTFALVNYVYAHTVPQREPWREMAQVIEKKIPADELLLICPHYNMIPLNRYFSTPRMQVGTGPLLGNEQIYKLLEGRQRFWLLVAQDGGSVRVFVPPQYVEKENIDLSHGLHLTGYALP